MTSAIQRASGSLSLTLLPRLHQGEDHCQESQNDLGERIGADTQRKDVTGLPLLTKVRDSLVDLLCASY